MREARAQIHTTMEVRNCLECSTHYYDEDAFNHKVWDSELLIHVTHEVCPECGCYDYTVEESDRPEKYRMTIREMKKACKENRYVLFRKASGRLIGCNGRLPFIKPAKGVRRRGDDYKGDTIGFLPCGINEYINFKRPLLKMHKYD